MSKLFLIGWNDSKLCHLTECNDPCINYTRNFFFVVIGFRLIFVLRDFSCRGKRISTSLYEFLFPCIFIRKHLNATPWLVERVYEKRREVRRFGNVVALFLDFKSGYLAFLRFWFHRAVTWHVWSSMHHNLTTDTLRRTDCIQYQFLISRSTCATSLFFELCFVVAVI